MKTLSVLIATIALGFSLFLAFDTKTYAEPPQPATDTTQNTPGPTVNEPDTGKNTGSVRTDNTGTPGSAGTTANDNRRDRNYGWLGLLGLTGLFGLAGRNRKQD